MKCKYYSLKLFCLAVSTYMYYNYMYTSISNVRSVGMSKSGVRRIVLSWKELLKTIRKMWTKMKFHQYLSTANQGQEVRPSPMWCRVRIKRVCLPGILSVVGKSPLLDLKIPNQMNIFTLDQHNVTHSRRVKRITSLFSIARWKKESMVFCLFGFFVPFENFHSYGDVTIAGEGLQILTCARHS